MAHKVVRVSAKQLQTIISEEASRYKRILELKRKKESVMSQLNEMYEADGLKEDVINEISAQEIEANKQKLEQVIDGMATQLTEKYPNQFINNKDAVIEKAKDDNFTGTVKTQQNKQKGTPNFMKIFLLYTPAAPTGLAKLGSFMGNAIRGGHAFGGGA